MIAALRRSGNWLFNQPYLLLSLTSLFWAGNIVLGRFVAGHVPPVSLSFLRWTGAFFIFLPFAWTHMKQEWPIARRHWVVLTLLSVTGIAAYNAIGYTGLQYTQAVNALLIQSLGPLLIALWGLILFGDRLALPQIFGILTSLIGAMVIVCRGSLDVLFSVAFNRGDILFFSALFVFAFYSALAKRRPEIHPFAFLGYTMGLGAILQAPLVIWEFESGHHLTFDRETYATLFYVMIFPSILAYLFFNRGVELIGPNRAAPFFHLMPVFGSILAIVFLHEHPQFYHLVGYVLVLCGVAIATRRASARVAT